MSARPPRHRRRDLPVIGGSVELGDGVEIASVPVASHVLALGDGKISIGSGTRIGHGAAISSKASVRIGRGVTIGAFVIIMDSDFHDAGDSSSAGRVAPVFVGDDVRIGHGVTLVAGAQVGAGAIVEAGSVVGGHIGPGLCVAGHPARVRGPGADTGAGIGGLLVEMFGLREIPSPSAELSCVPGLDSLGMLRLLLEIEGTRGVTIDDADFMASRTVGDLESLVDSAAGSEG